MNADELLAQLDTDYRLLLLAMTGRYLQAISPGQIVTPASLNALRDEATTMADNFEVGMLNRVVAWERGLTPSALGSPSEPFAAFVATVSRILRKNVSTVVRAMRDSRSDLGKMLHGAHGAIGKLLQKRIQSPAFKVPDSAGREWDAAKLFKFIVRDYLYQATIAATVRQLIADGETVAETYYPNDPERPGTVFALADFDSIRARVFHPNATAQVRKHVYPE